MEQINLGTAEDTEDGDSVRDAFGKTNENFSELNNTKAKKIETETTVETTSLVINVDSTTDTTVYNWDLTANSDFTISVQPGRSLTLSFKLNGFTLTFPSNIVWLNDAEPSFDSSGINIVEIFSIRNTIVASFIGYVNIVP